jgi:hypothetical protein
MILRAPRARRGANRDVKPGRILLIPALIAILGTPVFAAQLQVAEIQGVVRDIQQQPLGGAAVLLQDLTGRTVRSGVTGPDGSFRIGDVSPGAYVVLVQRDGATLLTQPLVVRGSLPVDLKLQAGLVRHDEVVVRGDAGPNTVEHPWSLAGEFVRERVDALPSQRVQAALGGLPGWTVEDNGLLHVRGVDDGLLYVQDGIPLYERVDRLFGLAPNPSGIASIHVIDGYIPPEFGLKSGAVIEVRSETGLRDTWSGSSEAGVADLGTGHVNLLAAGPVGAAAGLMLTGSAERSSRFLDPVDLENFHNRGRAYSGGAQATWRPGADVISGSVQAGGSRYDVPHGFDQEEASQDQRQRVAQWLVSGSWQRVLSPRTVWQVSAYTRRGAATLYGSRFDRPVTADAARRDRRYGGLWSVTHQRGRHTLKGGGELSRLQLRERFTFAVTDPEAGEDADLSEAAIAHDPSNPFIFADAERPALWSVYVQDVFRASGRLTLNFGVRFDRSRMLLAASQWSPRVGAALRLGPRTIARVSFMRLFQPPQAEYLLLASSEQARLLSPFVDGDEGGGSSVAPERQSAFDVAISHELRGGWQVEAGVWARRVRDVGDPNVFFGTTATVPNSVARQHASGFELRLDMRPRRGWSASGTYTLARAEQFGPITGGLFLEDEYLDIKTGTRFIPDHDQRHALAAAISYGGENRRWRVSGAARYQTGTPLGVDEDDLDELTEGPGLEVADVERGRVRPRTVVDLYATWALYRSQRTAVSLTAWMSNVTNDTYAFNYGNPFSGTHFGAPRRAGVDLAVRFGRGTSRAN